MTDASSFVAASRRFPPDATSVAPVRRFVAEVLAGADPDTVEDAKLLVSELVTNAVLHARTEMLVDVSCRSDRVQVRVTDAAGGPVVPRRRDADAMTGRGLQLVEALAAGYGVEHFAGGKTVWFELRSVSRPVAHAAAASWPDADLPPVAGDATVRVELGEIPVGLYLAAQRHRDALLRECALHAVAHGELFGRPVGRLVEAKALHELLTLAIGHVLADHPPSGPDHRRPVSVVLPAKLAAAAAELAEILDAGNAAARQGGFLTRPALPEIRAFRGWLLGQIGTQSAGAAPVSWAAPRAAAASGAVLGAGPWEPADAERTAVATVVADDDNRIVAVNDAAAALFGWRAAELVGERIVTLIPPEWRERHVVGFTNFLLTGESRIVGKAVRVPALHRDGHTFSVVFTLRVDQAPEGRIVFVAEFTDAGEVT